MRGFMILCLVALASADVSEVVGDGYDYQRPMGSDSGLVSTEDGPDDAGAMLGPGASGLGGDLSLGQEASYVGGGHGLSSRPDFGSQSFESGPTVSKRFFTVTGHDDGADSDDEEDSSSSTEGGHKNVDVIFANSPASSSLKSALRAVSRFAGDHQTAVYVLSQQLGAKQLSDALRTAGIKPSRPQVHFIKYKTPEEAAHAQQRIRDQYNSLGGSSEDGGHSTAPVQSVVGSQGNRRRPSYAGRPGFDSDRHGLGSGHHGFRTENQGFGAGRPGFGSSGLSGRYLPPRYSSNTFPSLGLSNRYLPPRY